MPLEPAPRRVPSVPSTDIASTEVDSAILETIRATVTGRCDALAHRQALKSSGVWTAFFQLPANGGQVASAAKPHWSGCMLPVFGHAS